MKISKADENVHRSEILLHPVKIDLLQCRNFITYNILKVLLRLT